ncbi:FliC/FljB family flagellin [Billgrantia desiderata]|uniref:FliC/FljB family flagellin n=1 Tax=Billgrantia desiderata TaxID=52021 RepID=UPI00089E74C4|nr:FliC/FljB family flagellin [Halomonas desiderata]SEG48128.1 flagellin [Halomonas desiderata]
MSVINTNITSMIGQANLNKSQNALQTSMERLSSGLRINSAKDDAAGQAIANRMTAQITGLAQAQRNANDGISVAQTAEGALNQINDNLQRIRELSVQASNGTNSQNDLQSIQDEIDQRLDEIDRISTETNFNGVNVLNTDEGLRIQVGANDGETITVNLQTINRDTLGLDGFSVQTVLGTDDLSTAALEDGQATPVAVDHGDITFTRGGEAVTVAAADFMSYDDNGTTRYAVKIGDDYFAADVTITDGDGTDDPTAAVTIGEQIRVVEGESLQATDGPMAALDAALNKVDSLRSELGAVQNRFEDAITNLNTNETNLAAARSRIEDADYAVEVANMTRAQILQQAGTSVLAQANQIPQNVLSLLG